MSGTIAIGAEPAGRAGSSTTSVSSWADAP